MKRALVVLPILLLLGGCASTGPSVSPTTKPAAVATPSAAPTEPADADCVVVSQSALDLIGASLQPGITVSKATAARAPRFEDTTIVAAQLVGEGVPADQSVAIFATTDDVTVEPADGLTLAVGPVATTYSSLTDSTSVLGDITLTEDGVAQAQACLAL